MKVGALAPLSPPGWVHAGRQLVAGLELAVQDLNTAGGINGRPLELLVRDTAANPTLAAAAVDEFADLGVAAVVGEYHSVAAQAAAERAVVRRLPFICSSAVIDNLTAEPTDLVARIAPPQSRGWSVYANYLTTLGHTQITVITQPSPYWQAGAQILKQHLDVTEQPTPDNLTTTAALLLVGHPEPALSYARTIRRTRPEVLIGAPAGQPELPEWSDLAGIPFLRYLPPAGTRTAADSFVALEGYDTILTLAERLRGTPWPDIAVQGTRGPLTFTKTTIWQLAAAPIQVAERDPEDPATFRVVWQERAGL